VPEKAENAVHREIGLRSKTNSHDYRMEKRHEYDFHVYFFFKTDERVGKCVRVELRKA
jgi:hypothetical protein